MKDIKCKVFHRRIENTRLKEMLFKFLSTFFNRISIYLFQRLRGWKKKEKAFLEKIELKQEIKVKNLNSSESLRIIKSFMPDLATHNRNGLLFDPDDTTSLTQYLSYLLERPNRHNEIVLEVPGSK